MSPSAAASRRNRGLLIGALAVLAVVLAAWLLGPALARGRVEQELRRRLGPEARFGELQVGGRGLLVEDLTTAELARGVSLSVERAQVTAFPPLLLWRPGGAIRGIELDGVTVHLSLPGAGTPVEEDVESDVESDPERGAGTGDDREKGSPPAANDPTPADDRGAEPSQQTLQDALERFQGVSMRALHRLAKGGRVRVRNASVVASTGENAPHELLSGLSFELTRTARDAFQTTGVGATPGGALDWDLTVEPRTLLATGHVAIDALPFAVVAPALPDLPWHDPLAARLGGRLDLEQGPGPGFDVGLEGWLEVRDLALAAPELHEEPLRGLALRVGGDGTWYSSERRLAFRGDVRAGDAAVELGLDGSVVLRPDRLELETELALPETSCRVAVGAIPAALRSGLEGFDWSGTIEGRVELRLDSVDTDAARLRFAIEDECRVLRAPGFALPERLRSPFLQAVRHTDGVLRERLVGPGAPGWVPLEQISPFLVHAVLAHEDAAFFRHRASRRGRSRPRCRTTCAPAGSPTARARSACSSRRTCSYSATRPWCARCARCC